LTTRKDRHRLVLIVATAVVPVALIVLLHAEGRHSLCTCGHFAVWVSDWCSSNTSQQLLDPYSLTHVLHGFLYFWLISLLFKRMPWGWQFWLAMLIESAWEVFENTSFVINKYRTETAALGYQGDTIVNSLGDLGCALLGFVLARRLGLWRSLIVFVLIEVMLTLWIHDSLLLQMLMLVRPVEAIKLWQICQ
jgi:hypothetical protein